MGSLEKELQPAMVAHVCNQVVEAGRHNHVQVHAPTRGQSSVAFCFLLNSLESVSLTEPRATILVRLTGRQICDTLSSATHPSAGVIGVCRC